VTLHIDHRVKMTIALPDTPFTCEDAARLGVGRHALRRMVCDGLLRRVFRNVYVAADVPDTIELRVEAVALVTPPYGVLVDRTAAWVHGVDTLAYHELGVLPSLEVFVIRDYAPRRRRGVDSGQRDLDPLDMMRLPPGILVTTPLRTALDLGCLLMRPLALATLDQFIRMHGLTIERMRSESLRYRGRRGVVQLRQLIGLADGRAESPGESWVRLALHDAGLPPPVPQFCVRVDADTFYRLDLAYPFHRVCIEYDGELYHSTSEQRAADELRRKWLRAQGWTVIVVTRADLDQDSVRRWTREVRSALAGM
jgi:hypothetical protein